MCKHPAYTVTGCRIQKLERINISLVRILPLIGLVVYPCTLFQTNPHNEIVRTPIDVNTVRRSVPVSLP
jgi:hypothetical protein